MLLALGGPGAPAAMAGPRAVAARGLRRRGRLAPRQAARGDHRQDAGDEERRVECE